MVDHTESTADSFGDSPPLAPRLSSLAGGFLLLIRLSRQDLHNARMAGNDTVALCRLQKITPRLENPKQSREDANALGFKAEYAVARVLQVEPPGVNVGSDFGIDLWFDDISIDVKLTNYPKGDLIFDSADKFKAKVAVLVEPTNDPAVMSIDGWMTRKEFISLATEKDFGHGLRLVVPNASLRPIEELWFHLQSIRFS